jgi:hydrogenase nickel incorporation protein HypA/HybF
MHELSLATALVEQLERICHTEQAPGVAGVRLRLGALAGVDPEALEFCFPLAAEGSCAAGAKLAFDWAPAELACDACGARGAPGPLFLACPACGSTRTRVTAGREFDIVSVELLTSGPEAKG